MTAWLIRRFVKDYENTENGEVRAAYGTLGSCVGIGVNVLLALMKFLMGILTGSVAVTADAANNLSDAAGSIVALVSTRVARKPVDAEHPFGHGRMEYLGSLGVGLLILVMAFTLLKEGMEAILTPAALSVSWPVLRVLGVSIAVKAWLYFFYRRLGRATDNGTLLAASKDSLSDVLATGAVLISTGLCALFGWRIDGYIGLVVALIVLKAGYEVCRDTVDRLLGGKPDHELGDRLIARVKSYPYVQGVHDFVMHDYGPGRCMASIHVEVPADGSLVAMHEVIDQMERDIYAEFHVPLCVHMDPVAEPDAHIKAAEDALRAYLAQYDPPMTLHDFRFVPGEKQTNLIFDVDAPPSFRGQAALGEQLKAQARALDARFHCIIRFDTNYYN